MLNRELDLAILKSLQPYKTALLDQFFYLCHYLDNIYTCVFISILIGLISSRKIALRILLIFVFSAPINYLIKLVFKEPRPWMFDPALSKLHLPTYSFPSGAAQSAIIVLLFTMMVTKNIYYRTLAFLFFVILSFSRVYLGVHFPLDILAGWFVGATIILIYFFITPHLEKLDTNTQLIILLAISFILMVYGFTLPIAQLKNLIYFSGLFICFIILKRFFQNDKASNK